jgi:hypothetical protein
MLFALLLLLLSGCTSTIDTSADQKDMQFVLRSAGMNITDYQENLENILKGKLDPLVRAEMLLVLGRLKKDQDTLRKSLDYFHKALDEAEGEEKAIIYETIASMEDNYYYYLRAAWEWKKVDNKFRSKLNRKLGLDKSNLKTDFDTSPVKQALIIPPENIKSVKIGTTALILNNQSMIVSQVDRVSRDWLSYQFQEPFSKNILTTFSERLSYDK